MENDPRIRHAGEGVQEPGVQVLGVSAAAADVIPPLSPEQLASDVARTAARVQEPGVQVLGESAAATDQHAAEVSVVTPPPSPEQLASDAAHTAARVQEPGVQVSGVSATAADRNAAKVAACLPELSQGMGASGPASDETHAAAGESGNPSAPSCIGLDAFKGDAERDATRGASEVQQPEVQVSGDSAAQAPQHAAS